MDRKEFVKRSFLGAGVVAAGIPVISAAQDEQKEVGFIIFRQQKEKP
jgi:hypothetical protein